MKQETNNEIDLLLRRLSRREGSGSPTTEAARIDQQHLDADEVNSYAENALPAAARARYTEHLAECVSCRKIVAQLSVSSGAVVTEKVTAVSELSGLKKFLGSFFSPLVLRYAVPALGVIAIMVVGLVVLRRERANDFVAQVAQDGRSESPAAEPLKQQTPSSGLLDEHNAKVVGSPTPQSRANKDGEVAPETKASGDTSVEEPGRVAKDLKRDTPVVGEQQPFDSAAPATPAPKPAAGGVEAQRNAEIAQKKKQEDVADQTVSANEGSKERAKESAKEEARRADEVAAARSGPARSQTLPMEAKTAKAPQGAGSRESERTRVEGGDKDDTETRFVAGRRFRKAGGVWVDTAYDSSRTTVNLARGSEQYRALVADEPAIRTIAEQLDGEIIVVWKGRAYRIR